MSHKPTAGSVDQPQPEVLVCKRSFSLRGLQNVQPSQKRLPRAHRLFENQDDRPDPEPDRDPEEVLRALPADEPSAERARGRGSPVGVQVGLSDQRLPRELLARVHRIFDRQLGVQVRQAAGAPSPAQALQRLRRDADCGPVRRPRRAVPALRQGQPGARRRLRHLRQHRVAEAEVRRRRVPGARHDLRRAAEGDDPARGLEQGPRDRRQDHPRHQGAGGLLRRHPADDRERDVHHQRHRARHRQPAPPFARRVLPLGRQDALRRADHPVSRLVGGVRVRHQEPPLRAHRPQAEVPRDRVPPRARAARGRRDPPRVPQRREAAPEGRHDALGRQRQPGRPARRQGHRRPRRELHRAAGQEDHQERARSAEEGQRRRRRDLRGRARGRVRRRRRRRSVDRRGDPRGQRAARAARHLDGAGQERRPHRRLLPRARRGGIDHQPDAEEGSDPHARRGAHRDLPAPASRRSADARQQPVALREHVLQPAEVRLLARRPPEAEHQARAEHAARREDPAPAGLLRGHQVPAQAPEESGQRRRHRSPRQPPRPVGRRAPREPVPHRPRPDGARDQGEDVRLPGNGDGHAARPDQREAGHGRDSRVLRVVAALAVHGPDQPALGDHAQAASLRARAGRPLARARRVRGPRRPSDALRAHLPD